MSATMTQPQPAPTREDDDHYEIVRGVRVEMPPMTMLSQTVSENLYDEMRAYGKSRRNGRAHHECMFILQDEPREVRKPDVAWVSIERWPLDRPIPLDGDFPGALDVAVEVVSTHDVASKVNDKVIEYFSLAVREVWLVFPKSRQVHVFESMDSARIVHGNRPLESRMLPGLSIELNAIFPATAPAG